MNNKFAGKSDEAVKRATGKSWDEWFKILDSAKASKMVHKDIVKLLHGKGLIKKGKGWPANRSFNEGWWVQSIVVGYEEKIGRRVVGQIADGNFSTSTSLTLEGTMDSVLKQWEKLVKGKTEFDKVKIRGDSRISVTPKWRYWKADLIDGSKINTDISEKGTVKILLSVTHYKIKDKKSSEKWKVYWKEFVEKI